MKRTGEFNNKSVKAWGLTALSTLGLLCAPLAHAPFAHAADPAPAPTEKPTPDPGDVQAQIDTVCGPLLKRNDLAQQASGKTPPNMQDPANVQKLQYCQAAQSSMDASDADSAMWKVWAAVGTVCTYACVASFVGGPTSEFICMGATVAGGVADAAVTKNFTAALMAVAGVGTGFAVNQGVNRAAQEGAKKSEEASQKDVGACINAAMAVVQVFMKFKSMNDNEDTAASNLAQAKSVVGANGTALTLSDSYSPDKAQAAPGTASGGGSGNSSNAAGDVHLTGTSSDSGSCAGLVGNTGNGAAVLQCAIASDDTLPGFVKNPKFAKEFQKETGKSLENFLGSPGNPTAMMGAAMSNGMNSQQAGKLATALEDLRVYAGAPAINGTYASGASGGGDMGGDGSAFDAAAFAQQFMDQMNPNAKKKDATPTGVFAVDFAYKGRGPASVADDRKLSIFDRVTYRYHFVSRGVGGAVQ